MSTATRTQAMPVSDTRFEFAVFAQWLAKYISNPLNCLMFINKLVCSSFQ